MVFTFSWSRISWVPSNFDGRCFGCICVDLVLDLFCILFGLVIDLRLILLIAVLVDQSSDSGVFHDRVMGSYADDFVNYGCLIKSSFGLSGGGTQASSM